MNIFQNYSGFKLLRYQDKERADSASSSAHNYKKYDLSGDGLVRVESNSNDVKSKKTLNGFFEISGGQALGNI